MTTPDIRGWCFEHTSDREGCGCPIPEPPRRYALTKKCVTCESPTAAPREVRGQTYCQECASRAESEWGVWIVYDFDMGYHVRAIFPQEIDALRFAQEDGYFQYVKWVTAGELTDQLNRS